MKAEATIFEEVLKKLRENPDSSTLREALTLVQYTQLEVLSSFPACFFQGLLKLLNVFVVMLHIFTTF